MAMKGQKSELLRHFEEAYREDIETITQVLTKITSLTSTEIKPHLDAMLEHLVQPKQHPLEETTTPKELAQAFREWADSHDRNTPLLSDYAVSRESIYEDEV